MTHPKPPLTITHHGSPARAQRLEAWMRRVVDPHIPKTAPEPEQARERQTDAKRAG